MQTIKEILPITKTLNVLYVEDDKVLQKETEILLNNIFKSVTTADDGEAALMTYRTAEVNSFDIVLTDVQMPRMDGLTLIQLLRNDNPNQIIIVLSAHDDADFFIKSIELNVFSYILKPLSLTQLSDVLSRVTRELYLKDEDLKYSKRLESIVKDKSKEIADASIIDPLTQIKNQASLLKRMEQRKDNYSIMILNIDQFGIYNDVYGFNFGDKILQEVGKKLQSFTNEKQELYRLNSDEFVFLVSESVLNDVTLFCKNILHEFSTCTFVIDGHEINISFTIGVDFKNELDCLHHAKIALKDARKHGRNDFSVFDSEGNYLETQRDTLSWKTKIKSSIKNGELRPFFQAIVNNETGKIEKYESLVRIVTEDEVILPYKFLTAAEVTGTLTSITKAVISEAFKTFAYEEDIEFSINITDQDLHDDVLFKLLQYKTKQYDISPSRVVLEILEDIVSVDSEKSAARLKELKEYGFKIAIDDFGTQGSNFSRLLDIDPDYIKIDGSFIKNIATDEKSKIIVETIVGFCKKLDIKVIAEFVHNEETLEMVKTLGIEFSQGFHLGKPEKTPLK